MNPLQKALDEIRFQIPEEILQVGFIPQQVQDCDNLISLDTRIKETILDNRVLVDIDIRGGTEVFLPLEPPVETQYIDPYTVIYHIPDEVVHGRPIVQIYSIHFGVLGYQQTGMAMSYTESVAAAETRKVLDAAMKVPPASTSYLNLVAHNRIMARYIYRPYRIAFARLRLGSDNALSHLRPQAIPDFAQLCVLAVKAYLYNHLVIKMDQGQLSGGQMLGAFRDVVSNWADTDEMYREALIRWRKISVFNDPEAHRRHIRTIVGGGA